MLTYREALTHGELDLLPFFEGLTAFTDDLTEVYENITLAFTRNEPKTLFVIEPFYGPSN
jgi:hypothetical protein